MTKIPAYNSFTGFSSSYWWLCSTNMKLLYLPMLHLVLVALLLQSSTICVNSAKSVSDILSVTDERQNRVDPGQLGGSFTGFEIGDPQNCPQTGVNIAEVLPGNGWDNLRNQAMGHVIVYNYSKCQIFQDRSFLLPNNIYAVPLKESNVETYSELMEHFSNFTSVTSDSINVGAHGSFFFGSISGSFSRDYQETKMHIAGDRSTASRVQLRYVMYTMRSEPDPELHPTFKNRLMDIASFLQSGDNSSAFYLSQLLVRDYGSHYVTSINAGAGIVRTDHLNSSYVNQMNSDTTTIKASASASFFDFLGFSGSYSHTVSNSEVTKFRQSAIDSKTISYGGPPVKANFSLDEWVDEMQNNLVALDRDGDPLYFVITPRTLPELPLDTVRAVANVVEEAVVSYYKHNLYQGCTQMDAPNFNYMANFDDNSCHAPYNNYTFGGVYQTCTGGLCGRTQVNPKTGGFSCPPQYIKVLLMQHTDFQCVHKCDEFLWIKYDCWDDCSHTDTSPNAAHYELYWCAASGQVESNSGYLFGGVYTAHTNNPTIQSKDCPPHFISLKVGWSADMFICVSDDYEQGFKYSLRFSGLFSCNSGNPLAINTKTDETLTSLMSTVKDTGNGIGMSLAAYQFTAGAPNWPKKCPSGYSQHLWLVNDGCEINYCIAAHSLTPWSLPEIRRPPYQDKPKIINNGTQLLISAHDQILVKHRESGKWKETGWTTGDEDVLDMLMNKRMKLHPASAASTSPKSSSSGSSNTATVTVLAIVATLALGAIIMYAVFRVVKRVRSPRPYQCANSPGVTDSTGRTPSYATFNNPTSVNSDV